MRVDVRLVDATDIVGPSETPAHAFRRKPSSTVRRAADIVANGEGAAFFSTGNTGAPLLGVAGHGCSSSKAVRNAVALCYRLASQDFVGRVASEMSLISDKSRVVTGERVRL